MTNEADMLCRRVTRPGSARSNESSPLGVDILEWKKARAFYRRHADRLGTWLSAEELRFVTMKPKPHEAFAMVFAAKEAAFKALGRECSVVPVARGRFKVEGRSKLEVTIHRHRRHVVACCVAAGRCKIA